MAGTETRGCWCGGRRLEPFGEGFLECGDCGTLVRDEMPSRDVTRVRDEDRDLYGRGYWFSHQAELGQADLVRRSEADLPERCLHWLAAVLAYKPPPGRALELGAAHGAMTALLGWSGYEATGLELSPWVAQWARDAFGVRMLAGPLEDQDIEAGSLDVVLAMDVLEHLPDPLGTMTRAAEALSRDGVLVVQTPCRPSGRSLAELKSAGHRFPEMLLPEHFYLMTEESVVELLRHAGLAEVVFEPAFFAHYDMFLVAGRRRPERADGEHVRRRLLGRPESRLVSALLELRAEANELRGKTEDLEAAYRQADADRNDRQRQVEELEAAFRQADADRNDRQRQVEELEAAYRQADADRTDRGRQIEELETAYRQADADRTDRGRQIEELETAYLQADADRTDRRRQIEELETHLDRTRRDKDRLEASLRDEIGKLREEVRSLHLDLDRKSREKAEAEAFLKSRIEELETDFRQAEERLAQERLRADELQGRVAELRELRDDLRRLFAHHRASRLYKAMVRLGRWRDYDRRVEQVLAASRDATDAPAAAPAEATWTFTSHGATPDRDGPIAVDLTPLLPGGENGGAKLVATGLARALSRLAPDRQLVLLTTEACHEELAELDGANVRRLRVAAGPTGLARLLADDPFALVFCPMTTAPWNDPRAPVVSVIHDLQYLTYPEFFDDAERAERERSFRRAVAWSDRIVTVSAYVRDRVIEHGPAAEDRVVAIHNSLSDRLPELPEADFDTVLARFGLERGRYFLYPANFWPHKNHPMLLTAFGQLHRAGHGDMRLVLTGADRPDPAPISEAIRRMGLEGAVLIAGWVSERDLAALLDGCRAVIFPSLYEGFGMPVAEAMARGRPVACSDVTALPEVAGDAALLFDPRKPEEIAGAMRRLSDDVLVDSLRRLGLARARELGDGEAMARSYLRVLEETLAAPRRFRDRLAGVFGDCWTPGRFVVSHGAGTGRELVLGFDNPRSEAVTVEAGAGDDRRATLEPGRSLLVTCRLPAEAGCLELHVAPTFCPADSGKSVDTRQLGLRLTACRISGGGSRTDLLRRMAEE